MSEIISIDRKTSSKSLFKISWQVTKWCNYRCSYCINFPEKKVNSEALENFRLLEKKHPTIDTLLQKAEEINNYINTIKKDVQLDLIGGEVTFIDWIKIFSEKITTNKLLAVKITTNLSNKLEYYENLKKYFESRNIQFILSVSMHASQIKDFDNFCMKAIKVATSVSVVINEDNEEETLKNINRLKELGYSKKIKINLDRNNISKELSSKLKELENKENNNKNLATKFIVTYDDGKKEELTKIQILSLIKSKKIDLNHKWKCRAFPRFKNGRGFVLGSCAFLTKNSDGLVVDKDGYILCGSKFECSFCNIDSLKKAPDIKYGKTIAEEEERLSKIINLKKIKEIADVKHKDEVIYKWYITRNNEDLKDIEYYKNQATKIKNNFSINENNFIYLKKGDDVDLNEILPIFDGTNSKFVFFTNLSKNTKYYINLIKKFNVELVMIGDANKHKNKIKKIGSVKIENKKTETSEISNKPLLTVNGALTVLSKQQLLSVLKKYDFSPKGFVCHKQKIIVYKFDNFEAPKCDCLDERCSKEDCSIKFKLIKSLTMMDFKT